MQSLTHHEVTTFLLAIAVLLGAARLLGELVQRWNQPAVLGEIIAGILLGPTVFGAFFPNLQANLFPATGPVSIALTGVTTLAITMFLMVAGLEIDLSAVLKQGKSAFAVGAAGIVVPFGLSFFPAWFAPDFLGAEAQVEPLVFALFIATAMSITALPVIVKILLDLNLIRTEMGVTVVAAAVFNDLIGWIIFAFVLAMIGGHGDSIGVGNTVVLILLFASLILTVGRWIMNKSLPWIQANTTWPGGILGGAFTLALCCAALTEWIGVHAIFGAFLFGVALGDSQHLRRRTRATIEQFVSFIFAPLFFATIGLRVDFLNNFDITLVAIVLALATLGKVLGCNVAARWMGFAKEEARAIGFGMNARGAMEIILGLLALEAGIIGDRLFVALVVMALVTSLTSGLLIQRSFGKPKKIHFADLVTNKTFLRTLEARNRRDALKELSELAAHAANIDPAHATSAVWQRELILSSALGRQVAVPHARIEGLQKPIVAMGIAEKGIDFDAPDGAPVRVIILVLTSVDQMDAHLSILASIARVFREEGVVHEIITRVRNVTELRAYLRSEATTSDDATH